MPTHTVAERKKKRIGLVQRARSFINEGIGGFKKREASEALTRSTIQQPFTDAPGQRTRRNTLIGRKTRRSTPIIRKVGRSQPGNLAAGVESTADLLRKRKRQLESVR